jgi:hypothetical protein
MLESLAWKPDWQETKKNLVKWWNRDGLALDLRVKRRTPIGELTHLAEPRDLESRWYNPQYRCSKAEQEMASTKFLAESFPYFDTQIGPGSLGTFLGAKVYLDEGTTWYYPCIDDADTYGPIRFDTHNNTWWDRHIALVEEGLRRTKGRYLVGMPDMIEGLDTLAALRGDMQLLYDLCERPGWVRERLAEINQAYFEAFDLIYGEIKSLDGGQAFCAFRIWGPGKTAKLQCDISAAISPRMFKTFVYPFLAEQCKWLDYSMYHLDGTTALQHLDLLLDVEYLHAIEWTPQAGKPGGGSSEWYNLYRRIKEGEKGIQAVGVQVDEVIPLLDAVGPKGTFICLNDLVDEATGEKLLKAVEPYRS